MDWKLVTEDKINYQKPGTLNGCSRRLDCRRPLEIKNYLKNACPVLKIFTFIQTVQFLWLSKKWNADASWMQGWNKDFSIFSAV